MRSFGFSVIYPPECKELSESLRVDELRKRINDLSNSLDKILNDDADDSVDPDTSANLSRHDEFKGLFLLLISSEYTQHQDVDIRLRIGVCICKLMKIFCPQNPFSGMLEEKLLTKQTLLFLLSCIQHLSTLKNKGDVSYPKLHTILYICCQIDLFMWCASLEDETVLFECVKTTFSIVKNISVWAWTDTSVIRQMLLDMIVKVIVQSESLLSREVVTFLLELLIEPAKSTQPGQHTFARDLILRTARHLEYTIQMLLQNAMIAGIDKQSDAKTSNQTEIDAASIQQPNTSQVDADDDTVDVSPSDPIGEHCFLMIYALHTIQDSIVTPVLPTIELKLKSISARDRKRSFRLLARLFSEPNSLLHEKNPSLWNAFLSRFNDIDQEVRKLCIHMVPQLLKQNPDLPHDQLLNCIQQRAHDPVEDVRLLVLRTVAVLVNDAPDAITEDLYNLLKERSRDKSLSIRKEAATALASVYKHLIKQEQPPADRISLALNTILHMYYHPSVDDRIVVERLFKSSLVPYHFDTAERVRALFTCYSLMDEASVRAMQEMFKVQFTVLSLVRDVLQLLATQEGKTISSQLSVDLMDRLHHLSNMLPKSDKCVEHLKRFFNQVHADKALRSQLVKLTKPGCTCSHATNIMRDLLKRVDSGSTSGSGSSSEFHLAYVRSVKILLERSAPVLFDKDFGQELLTQLVVVREAGTVFGIIGAMDIIRALRLLYSLAVYFRRVLPTDEVMDYLVGILSDNTEPNFEPITVSGPDEPSSTTNELDPPTVQELALNILCCLLGSSNLMFEADSLNQYRSLSRVADTHFNGSEPNLQERASDFLPLLQRLCCTGMTLRFPALPCSLDSHLTNASGSGRPANTKGNRGGTKRAADQRLTPPLTSENDKLSDDVYLAGLAWRRERRRAKLATQVVLCMLRVAQRFRQNSTKSHSPPPVAAVRVSSPGRRDDVDLDAEGTKCGGTNKNDVTTEPSLLELKIREALDSIVQTCLACPIDSPDYVACLTSLSRVALQLPGIYNREFKKLMTKSLVQHVLTRDTDIDNSPNSATTDNGSNSDKKQTSKTTKMATVGNLPPVAAADWLPDGYIPQATRAKLSAIKLMTNWLRGLRNEVKPVAQAVIRLLHRIIIHDGDLNRQRKLMPGEMSRMRLVAAVSWLKLAHSQAYVESIEVDWYQSMTYIICDPCPHVRSHFLTKLNQGLYRLRLPLEYIAIFAHAVDVPDSAFKQRAKQLLTGNIQRRRDFLDRHASYRNDTKFLYGLLPDFVLPYLIYLLAHDPEWADINDANRLNRIKASLWFVMEPIVSRGHNFVFLRKIIEKIKHTRDALAPDDTVANTKLYVVCDIALGLLLTRASDLTMKEYPADVKLPKTLFLATPASFKNPDFAQLLDPAVNAPTKEAGKEQTTTVKPLIQFTPSKSGRAIKEGWMPAELLREKHSVSKIPKTAPPEPVTKEPGSSALETNAVQLTGIKVGKAGRKVATRQTKLNVTMPSPQASPHVTPEEETNQQESESLPAKQITPRKYTRIVLGRPEIESDNTNSPVNQRKRPHPSSVTPSKRRKLFTSSKNANKSESEKVLSAKSKTSTSIPTTSVKSRVSKTVTKIRRTVTKTVTLARGRSATKLQLVNGCGTSKSPKKPLLSVSTSLTKRSSIVSAVLSCSPSGHTGRTRGRPPKSLSKPQTKLTRSRSSLNHSQSRLPTNKDRKRRI